MFGKNDLRVGWGAVLALVVFGIGGAAFAQDVVSDRVGSTSGQFRVDESGAATYSIPILTVPGTAGVTPQVALSYSSHGSDGPIGRGWAISGLSAIARCRGTREAGDFITGGVPGDGMPPAISFNAHDRYCLDGQRLLPAPSGAPACRSLSGFIVANLRTQSESFQRVCAYTPSANSANGPAFFSVERQDGSTSFYGDRNDWIASANRMDGYVNSTASGHQSKALSWRQTRFLDSTGNYIDFTYLKNPGGSAYPGESLIDSIQYTGKKQLAGQSGGNLAPYAKLQFNYASMPSTEFSRASVAGGVVWQTRYLTSITVIGDVASNQQARFYALGYATSPSGSGARTLTSITECRDSTRSVCLAPTNFAWSGALNQYSSTEMVAGSGFDGLISLRLGDVDGDGITDVVWFKRGQGSGCNNKGQLYVSFGELDASGRLTFNRVNQSPWCNPRDISRVDDGWHLFDYDGDGRDDIFVAGMGSHWALYPSQGRPTSGGQVFNFSNNLIASLSPGIPIINYGSRTALVILADLNGDSLLDVVYPGDSADFDVMYRARLAVRQGSGFR